MGKMAQQVKAPAAKPDNMGSNPETTHRVGKNKF